MGSTSGCGRCERALPAENGCFVKDGIPRDNDFLRWEAKKRQPSVSGSTPRMDTGLPQVREFIRFGAVVGLDENMGLASEDAKETHIRRLPRPVLP
jgi:hypothetical protein